MTVILQKKANLTPAKWIDPRRSFRWFLGNGPGPVSYEETSSFDVVKRRFVSGHGGTRDHRKG